MEMQLLENGGWLLLELIDEVTNEMSQIQSIKQRSVNYNYIDLPSDVFPGTHMFFTFV